MGDFATDSLSSAFWLQSAAVDASLLDEQSVATAFGLGPSFEEIMAPQPALDFDSMSHSHLNLLTLVPYIFILYIVTFFEKRARARLTHTAFFPDLTSLPDGLASASNPASTNYTTPSDQSEAISPSLPPESTTSKRHKPGATDKTKAEDPDTVLKRQRNTLAARKYRQKRLDRISELEDALARVTRERDALALRLARQEAETAAMKEILQMKSK